MYPKVNQNIVITLKGQDQSWKSIVAEVGENEILIGFPMDQTIFGLMQNGTSIEVSYISNGARYLFSTEIIGREIENILIAKLKKPKEKEILKIQLRDYFRVDANLRVVLKEMEINSINISAGGLLCSCDSSLPMKPSEVVSGIIYVPNTTGKEINMISFQCKIIRVDIVKELGQNQVALKFIRLNQQDQKRILQYCFEKQRQMRLNERMIKPLRR